MWSLQNVWDQRSVCTRYYVSHFIENTFYLHRTHSIENTFVREHGILLESWIVLSYFLTHFSVEKTFYREHGIMLESCIVLSLVCFPCWLLDSGCITSLSLVALLHTNLCWLYYIFIYRGFITYLSMVALHSFAYLLIYSGFIAFLHCMHI